MVGCIALVVQGHVSWPLVRRREQQGRCGRAGRQLRGWWQERGVVSGSGLQSASSSAVTRMAMPNSGPIEHQLLVRVLVNSQRLIYQTKVILCPSRRYCRHNGSRIFSAVRGEALCL